MRKFCTVVGLISIGLTVGCGGAGSSGGAAIQQVASADDLSAKIDAKDVVVVHALDAASYQEGHLPGAINVDYEKMTETSLPEDKDAALVFYCAGPMCPVSSMAANKAAAYGYRNVWVYKGGIKDWKASGRTLVSGE